MNLQFAGMLLARVYAIIPSQWYLLSWLVILFLYRCVWNLLLLSNTNEITFVANPQGRIILSWTLQAMTTDQLVRPGLARLAIAVERPMPTQIAHLKQGTRHIIEDREEPEYEQFFGSQATTSGTVSRRALRPTASDAESFPAINPVEFPWASGRLYDAAARTVTDTVS
ncbi:hypothetical protein BU17DRAFT_69222 [Hysterangium stoloniferum]|nr:hypothetical protein BU17DRAFT_69222 [Hysterangium stoloniferum]